MARKKMSREEVLLKKRMRERERYNKIKSDPMRNEIQKEKERRKYENKKKKKQVKLVHEMTPREVRLKRKTWRKNSTAYYRRKQSSNCVPDSPPDSESENVPVIPVQVSSGRKRINRDRSKVIKRNKKLIKENEYLKRSREKYRKRYYRLLQKQKTNSPTPKKKVNAIMKRMNREEVARKLLFGEALQSQIKKNLQEIKSNKRKRIAVDNILGDRKILKKYKVTKEVNKIVTYRCNFIKRRQHQKLTLKYKQEIQAFLEDDENSRAAPGKKECITVKKVKKQKRYLNETMKLLYRKFQSTKRYKISYSFFCKNRPFWVVYQKLHQRDTCLCKVHANMEFIVTTLSQNKVINQKTAKEVAKQLCCENEYSVQCLKRQCKKCCDKVIQINQFEGEMEVHCYEWVQQKDSYKDKSGKVKQVKHTTKLRKRVTLYNLIQQLITSMDSFMAHEATILNQYSALKYLKLKLSENEAVIQIDFSENYSLKYANEIQSFHFGGSRQQISLHTTSLQYKESTYGSLKCKSICTFSKCLSHDSIAILAHLEPVFKIIKEIKPHLKGLHFVSDSPSNQYRNKYILYIFGKLVSDYFPELELSTWNYLEAGHGKGAADGIGGTVKRTADRLVTEGKDIDSFECLITSLKEHTRSIEIEVINENDISNVRRKISFDQVKPFKGMRKVHQIINTHQKNDQNAIWLKTMSCFKCVKDKPLLDSNNKLNCSHFNLGLITFDQKNNSNQNSVPNEFIQDSLDKPFTSQGSFEETEDVSKSEVPTIERELRCASGKPLHQENKSQETIHWIDLKEGLFVLVRVSSYKKTAIEYKYVCIVQNKDEEDGDITVQGLRLSNEKGTEFVLIEKDIFNVDLKSVIQILPEPTIKLKNRAITYQFSDPVEVFEKA